MSSWPVSSDTARRALAGARGAGRSGPDVLDTWARVAWNLLTEPGDGPAGALIAECGAAQALEIAVRGLPAPAHLSADVDRGRERWMPRWRPEGIAEACAAAARAGVHLIVPGDPSWPAPVDDLGSHRPVVLWVRGSDELLRPAGGAVALVGARAATGYGEHVAGELAADLAGSGTTVVSGAAYGIDGAAHRAALSVGGTTLAFLAGGADRPYPAGHSQLIDRIATSGAVISEAPCGAAPTKWRFLQRNRLIAAISDATVVVEAGWRSGSLNTAGHAASLGRPLGAVPGPITSTASAGCHRLMRDYDARCITSADDVRELLGWEDGTLLPAVNGNRTDRTTRVMDALSVRAERDLTQIARSCGLAPAEVEAELGILALSGGVERGRSGWRRVASWKR
ncbi:DNA-processing protein DprA [Microbacterium sp. ET2]|uniref:DNA-processing protein DprA n=1 Tax=Microbacterium albipurpureum TaxID=3050384 RepID=UPI00259CCB1A|nr:DNA-processing protein DprA [Microbacterium sp. ET2 (Ac-2212)]WJL95760.1 DNA-processing protein DprA [Microbacterium sp. ET2 (Ac-2212)]